MELATTEIGTDSRTDKFRRSDVSKPGLQRRKQVLLIEDDAEFAELLSGAVRDVLGVMVDTAADPFEAMEKMVEGPYDALILDWNLPYYNGARTLEKTEISLYFEDKIPEHWEQKQIPVVVISAHSRENLELHDSAHFRVAGFVSKRQGLAEIILQLRRSLGDAIQLD